MKKRNLNQLKAEIRHHRTEHLSKWPKRKTSALLPFLMSAKELDSLMHIVYLEGVYAGIKDERAK